MTLNNDYQEYEDWFDPMHTSRKARRRRKPKAHHQPKVADRTVVCQLADEFHELESGFKTTYQPSKHERGWLLQSLSPFYHQALITDVLSIVKGGKEASVYRCKAHPSTGVEVVAAKVYRPRMFRELSNDAVYRQGRQVLKVNGKPVKATDQRLMRAVGKKSAFGQQVSHTSWLMHEYTALQTLHAAGVTVPRPYASAENALLMAYCGDDLLPAPTLVDVPLDGEQAHKTYHHIMNDVETMLSMGLVHGDLSAYNVLYHDGLPVIIDLPQVVQVETNTSAYPIFVRDVTRISEHFGVDQPDILADKLWARHVGFSPPPPLDEDETC